MGCIKNLAWGLRHFPWSVILLGSGVAVCTALAQVHLDPSRDAVSNILDDLNVQESALTRALTGPWWIVNVTWVLMGIVVGGCLINVALKVANAYKRDAFRHGNMSATGAGRFSCSSGRPTLAFYGIWHCAIMLNTIWMFALLCFQVVVLVALKATEQVAKDALSLFNKAVDVTSVFLQDAPSWLNDTSNMLEGVSARVSSYCTRVACDAAMEQVQTDLSTLVTKAQDIIDGLDGSNVCPSTGCLNLNLLWFLNKSGCLCEPTIILDVQHQASSGSDDSITAIIYIAVTALLMLLLLSKSAMVIKAQAKDMSWMRRMHELQSRLAEEGVHLPLSVLDTASGSIENFLVQPGASAPPAKAGEAAAKGAAVVSANTLDQLAAWDEPVSGQLTAVATQGGDGDAARDSQRASVSHEDVRFNEGHNL